MVEVSPHRLQIFQGRTGARAQQSATRTGVKIGVCGAGRDVHNATTVIGVVGILLSLEGDVSYADYPVADSAVTGHSQGVASCEVGGIRIAGVGAVGTNGSWPIADGTIGAVSVLVAPGSPSVQLGA